MSKPGAHHALWGLALATLAFCAYSGYLYAQAGTPPAPPKVRDTPELHRASAVPPLPSLNRYTVLSGGRVFFGQAVFPNTEPSAPPVYVSGLTLRGIMLRRGQAPVAVLARAGSPPEGESWTVRAGDTIMGETVSEIRADSVLLSKDGQDTVLVLP